MRPEDKRDTPSAESISFVPIKALSVIDEFVVVIIELVVDEVTRELGVVVWSLSS